VGVRHHQRVGVRFLYLPLASSSSTPQQVDDQLRGRSRLLTRWFDKLVHDSAVKDAAWLSVRIRFFLTVLALLLGSVDGLRLRAPPRSSAREP